MPHKDRHRGQHPKDAELFASSERPKLRAALYDVAWLLSKGYPSKATIKLVGDRFNLRERQRLLLSRCACSQAQQTQRRAKALEPDKLVGETVYIDGFNLIIGIESVLSGGFIFVTLDGSYKDMASIHKSHVLQKYRRLNKDVLVDSFRV